jgi:hypothetical protein
MIPLLASGAASLANVLVNRAVGSSSGSGGSVTLDSKAFERALNKASGSRGSLTPAEQQAAALNHQLMHSAEIEAAVTARPVGSVAGVEVRQDGSVFLQTTDGPVAVQLSLEGRELARQTFAASAVAGAGNLSQAGVAPVSLVLPAQGAGLR